MNNNESVSFLKGSLRYKQSTEKDIQLQIPLSGRMKELDEYQRQISINLAEVYNNERQKSTLFLPSCKFQLLFSNAYTGVTSTLNNPYPPINNNLYYVNSEATKQLQIIAPNTIQWPGFPQYNEFSFIRNDYNVEGYTSGNDPHVEFRKEMATKYNWNFYLTYSFSAETERDLFYIFNENSSLTWKPKDGIPYIMQKVTAEGKTLWQFRCAVNHNLSITDYVKLPSVILEDSSGNQFPNRNIFPIYSFGDGSFGSEKTIFNILDLNYFESSSSFLLNKMGQFLRVVDPDNATESVSKYYVRVHKILTSLNDVILTNCGFEQNAFKTQLKFESGNLTPNFVSRVSVKEDSQSYNISFKKPINLAGLVDNRKRPISELFISVVNKGYFGYFNPPVNNQPNSPALKEGWKFNITEKTNSWWYRTTPNSDLNLGTATYNRVQNGVTYNFYYNQDYNFGDSFPGDFCEWNDITQQETVLSEYYHKFVYNPSVFDIQTSYTSPVGFYYKTHNKIKVRSFSDYVEEGNLQNTDSIPNYAFYSQNSGNFLWRDIYEYGFIDTDGEGVNYPFMNGIHYPYQNFFFRIIPEGTNVGITNSIQLPEIDGCE
jgi:hypothetical protein